MAESLRQKAHVLSFAFLHSLANKAIDMNSIPVIEQYIRELEQGMDQMREAMAQNDGAIAGLQRQLAALHQQESTLDSQADQLLQLKPPREDLAALVDKKLQELEPQVQGLEQQLTSAKGIHDQYIQVMSNLEAKHKTMQSQLARLSMMDQTASAEERAAHAIHQVTQVMGSDMSFDSVAARIQQRSDTAHARLSQEMGGFAPDPVAAALADASTSNRMAERKARLGLGTTVTELPPPQG